MGKHTVVFRLNLVTLMGIGFGLGTVLVASTDLGVAGAWIGMDTGLFVLSGASLLTLYLSDWQQAATEAAARTEEANAATATAAEAPAPKGGLDAVAHERLVADDEDDEDTQEGVGIGDVEGPGTQGDVQLPLCGGA